MGGSPDNNSNAPLRTGGGHGSSVEFVPQQKWDIESTHPEALYQGIASGIGGLAGGVASKFSSKPNAAGGYNSKAEASAAAPYRGGISFEPDMGYIPRAQGVNYQPDQFQRMYGYNYRGTGA
jgi:hypothetical protein